MSDPGHIPGQADQEFPDEAPETTPEPEQKAPEDETPAESSKAETKGEESQEEDTTPDSKEDGEKDPPPSVPKKRSVYDDLKDKRKEVKAVTETAAAEKARADAAEARAAELQALLDANKEAITPEEKETAADDIDAFAKAQGLDPKALNDLIGIVQKRLPQQPQGLTPEEAAEWRRERAENARRAEDAAILAEANAVRKQLSIARDEDMDAVMKEVVRLAHTPEFHDKEIDYIVWKNQEKLSKLVSPKKPSFESGAGSQTDEPDSEVDFAKGGLTPEQASRAMYKKQGSNLEVRRQTR